MRTALFAPRTVRSHLTRAQFHGQTTTSIRLPPRPCPPRILHRPEASLTLVFGARPTLRSRSSPNANPGPEHWQATASQRVLGSQGWLFQSVRAATKGVSTVPRAYPDLGLHEPGERIRSFTAKFDKFWGHMWCGVILPHDIMMELRWSDRLSKRGAVGEWSWLGGFAASM
jgi:hypothetical protein